MDNQMKLGAVLIGGYLLGRTKKGGMALRIASRMALSGTNTDPRELVQDNLTRLLDSELVEQLRDQMLEVAKAAFDARMQGLAEGLNTRTEALKNPATDAVGGVTSTLTKDNQEEQDEGPDEEEDAPAEDRAEDDEGEAEGAEAEEEPEESEDEGDQDGDDADDKDEAIRARATELRRKRIHTLRNMATEMFEDDEAEEIENASKEDLARWIAEAESEDEEND